MITVVIIHYNTMALLDVCLESIYNSLLENDIEIIVVDNASIDDSIAMINNNYPAVRLIINKKNMGFGYANNQAMMVANGEWYLLINSDAELRPGVMDALLEAAKGSPKVAMVGPKVVFPDGRMQYTAGPSLSIGRFVLRSVHFIIPHRFRSAYRKNRENFIHQSLQPVNVESISAVTLLVNKRFYKECGGFDENYFMYVEDVDWALRARKARWEIMYVPSVYVVHLNGASSDGSFRDFNPRWLTSVLYFFKKHKGWGGCLIFRVVGCTINLLKLVWGVFEFIVTLGGRKDRPLISQALAALKVLMGPAHASVEKECS